MQLQIKSQNSWNITAPIQFNSGKMVILGCPNQRLLYCHNSKCNNFVALHYNFKHQVSNSNNYLFLYMCVYCEENKTIIVVFSILIHYYRYFRPPYIPEPCSCLYLRTITFPFHSHCLFVNYTTGIPCVSIEIAKIYLFVYLSKMLKYYLDKCRCLWQTQNIWWSKISVIVYQNRKERSDDDRNKPGDHIVYTYGGRSISSFCLLLKTSLEK
jgi:hypothetical protein